MMNELIEQFPAQLQEAINIGKSAKYSIRKNTYTQVVVSGLGGSGIGGTIVQEFAADKIAIPFLVNKDYFIPKSVNKDTLFIACSYSGNTEETLQATELAMKQKASIVCVSSGGLLAKFADENGYPCIRIPEGRPPRACIGYAVVQLLFILKKAGLLQINVETEINTAIKRLLKEGGIIQKKAETIASSLQQKSVAIYTVTGMEGMAIRFRQQLNENSKILCWHHVIPEMTHNEIVGWRTQHPELAVVFCYADDTFSKNLKRLKVLKKVVQPYVTDVIDIKVKGQSYWDKLFYFIHLTDWISVYLAELNQQDAVEVKVIDRLKREMAKK
jgi:glucose/mannose-6-phosphate isomerase